MTLPMIPDDVPLPAAPNLPAWATVRDDPLTPATVEPDEAMPTPWAGPPAEARKWGYIIAGAVAVVCATVTLGAAAFWPALALVGFAIWLAGRGPSAKPDPTRALAELSARSPYVRAVRALGATRTAPQVVIPLKPSESPSLFGFDPHAPSHLQAADAIHACRARDGLGFMGPPRAARPGALVASVEPFFAAAATSEERLAQWTAVAGFLEGHAYPDAVWLAAVACREQTSPRRGAAALRRLAAMRGQRIQLDRVLQFIDAEGPWCARGAAAVFRADAEALIRLIAEAPSGQTEGLISLIEARWQAAPDPAIFDAWAAGLDQGLALARAELPGAGEARWHALLGHGAPEVAGQAAWMMLSEPPPLPLLGARSLLARPDVQRLFADGAPPQTLIDAVIAAMEQLTQAGDADDLRLLGPWCSDPRVGAQARQSHRTLKAWLGVDVLGDAGGLALAAGDEASGGLSPADGGGLSPADPEVG